MHPNGLFFHNRFQPGGNTAYNEYSLKSLVHTELLVPSLGGSLGREVKHAELESIFAAEMKRSAEDDALRREAHLECSMATLEGVSVGQYRYYQGHSSIKEYSMGNMCICWGECFCTVICTRYADMKCPCREYLTFEE